MADQLRIRRLPDLRTSGGPVLAASGHDLWAAAGHGRLSIWQGEERRWEHVLEGPEPSSATFAPSSSTLQLPPFRFSLVDGQLAPQWPELAALLAAAAPLADDPTGNLEVTAAAIDRSGQVLLAACRIRPPRRRGRSSGRRPPPFLVRVQLDELTLTASVPIAARLIGPALLGRELAVLTSNRLHLYAVDPFSERFELGELPTRASAICLSDDESRLLAGSHDGTVCLWDTADGECLARWTLGAGIAAVAFAPGPQRAVCCSEVGRIALLEAGVGEPIDEARLTPGRVQSAAFCPTAKQLIAAAPDDPPRLLRCLLEW